MSIASRNRIPSRLPFGCEGVGTRITGLHAIHPTPRIETAISFESAPSRSACWTSSLRDELDVELCSAEFDGTSSLLLDFSSSNDTDKPARSSAIIARCGSAGLV